MKFSITLTIEVENKPNLLTRFSWSRRKKQIKERDGETCRYCGKYAPDGHVDHIMPLSRGGNDDPDNLAWACSECNNSKGDKTLVEWGDRPLPSPILPEPESEPEIDSPESAEDEALIKKVQELYGEGLGLAAISDTVFGYHNSAKTGEIKTILGLY